MTANERETQPFKLALCFQLRKLRRKLLVVEEFVFG